MFQEPSQAHTKLRWQAEPRKRRGDHAPRLPSQIEGGRRAYREGNEPLKRRKRRAVLDADSEIEPGARRSLDRIDMSV